MSAAQSNSELYLQALEQMAANGGALPEALKNVGLDARLLGNETRFEIAMVLILRSLVATLPQITATEYLQRVRSATVGIQLQAALGNLYKADPAATIAATLHVVSRTWLAQAYPRRLNFVQHLGAREYVVFDGDSLLMNAICNQDCDWDMTQPLHVIYMVEEQLARYLRSGSNFGVCFFDSHGAWWNATPQFAAIRAALFVRLAAVATEQKKFEVARFTSMADPNFAQYVEIMRPATIVLSDGDQFPMVLGSAAAVKAQTDVRCFAIETLSQHRNIAFLERAVVRDATVFMFAIRADSSVFLPLEPHAKHIAAAMTFAAPVATPAPSDEAVNRVIAAVNAGQHTARDLAIATALTTFLKDHPADAAMAKVLLLSSFVLDTSSLEVRAQPVAPSAVVKAFLNKFTPYMPAVTLGLANAYPAVFADTSLVDAYDGHMVAVVADLCAKGAVKSLFHEETLKAADALWAVIAPGQADGISSLKLDFATAFDADVPEAAAAAVPTTATDKRRIAILSEILEKDSEAHAWNNAGVRLFDQASWVASCPNNKIDSFAENKRLTENVAGFLATLQENAETMNVLPAVLEPRGPTTTVETRESAAALAIKTQNTLRTENKSAQELLNKISKFEVRTVAAAQSQIAMVVSDIKQPVSRPQWTAFLQEQNVKEYELLFEKQLFEEKSDRDKSIRAALAAKSQDLQLQVFTVLRQHVALRMHYAVLVHLWGEWEAALIESNAKVQKLKYAVFANFFIELQLFIDRLKSFGVTLQPRILSHIVSMVRLMNFPDSYVELIVAEISDAQGAPFVADQSITSSKRSGEVETVLKSLSRWCPARFQLMRMGERLPRERGQRDPERRVDFPLDKWQRRLMDIVSSGGSALVTAPTSSGKTFISYYCMTNVIMDPEHRDVAIYVCPTRALVNQALSDVYARFGKMQSKMPTGTYVVGALGGDPYIVFPFKCQILITLPESLETVLLSPQHQQWASRIKYIIYDEIHSIDMNANGSVWERLLLMTRCPFVALSATLGQPQEFVSWLNRSRSKVNLNAVELVPGPGDAKVDRYNDIEKFICLNETTEFAGVDKPAAGFEVDRIHPLSCISFEMLRHKLPEDLPLVPSEVVDVFMTMQRAFAGASSAVQSSKIGEYVKSELARLDPSTYFDKKRQITRAEARALEGEVMILLRKWGAFADSDFSSLPEDVPAAPECANEFRALTNAVLQNFSTTIVSKQQALEARAGGDMPHPDSFEYVRQQTLPLLTHLFNNKQTPSLLFSFEETQCEALVEHVVSRLEEAERDFRATPAYKDYTAILQAEFAQQQQEGRQKEDRTKQRVDSEGNVVEKQLGGTTEKEPEFQMPDVLPLFTFKPAISLIGESEFASILKQAEWGAPSLLIRALKRGIGYHHPGVGGKLRVMVERLFRKLALSFVFATETLALGVHSPCKVTVIAGDNPRLNTSQFRQMAGRAGRRGHDYLGLCMFVGVPFARIERLLTNDLDRLGGHMHLDAVSVLRMELFVQGTLQAADRRRAETVSAYVTNVIHQLFSEPLLLEARWRAQEKQLEPMFIAQAHALLNWAAQRGFVANSQASTLGTLISQPLSTHREVFTGGSAFVFAHALGSGMLHRATVSMDASVVYRELMEVVAWLFSLHPDTWLPLDLHDSVKDDVCVFDILAEKEARMPTAASIDIVKHRVVLRPLAECMGGGLKNGMEEFNRSVLEQAVAALATVADAACPAVESLPLATTVAAPRPSSDPIQRALDARRNHVAVRSGFSALSGRTDVFADARDIVHSLRQGLFIDAQQLPYVDIRDSGRRDGRERLMNAAFVDFLTSGLQQTGEGHKAILLREENHITERESWYVLSNLSRVVDNIVEFFQKNDIPPGHDEKVEETMVRVYDDHVMEGLERLQDLVTDRAHEIKFTSNAVTEVTTQKREERRKNRKPLAR